jgi:hypothetical protein
MASTADFHSANRSSNLRTDATFDERMIMKSKFDGREMAMEFENFVNSMSNEESINGFVEYVTDHSHRTLQQSMMGVFLKCIKSWSKKGEYEFDLRNKATVDTSKKIMTALDNDERLPFI